MQRFKGRSLGVDPGRKEVHLWPNLPGTYPGYGAYYKRDFLGDRLQTIRDFALTLLFAEFTDEAAGTYQISPSKRSRKTVPVVTKKRLDPARCENPSP